MMTKAMLETGWTSDERLVELSLADDREAFGHIVARYQSPICALAFRPFIASR